MHMHDANYEQLQNSVEIFVICVYLRQCLWQPGSCARGIFENVRNYAEKYYESDSTPAKLYGTK